MLVIKISDRKPTTPAYIPPTYAAPTTTTTNLAIYNEARRRDNLIKNLFKEFKHKVGDLVEPVNTNDLATWGMCTIISVVDSYMQLEKDFKWPANDNPMIVTASSDNGEIFYATTNYFK